MVCTLNPHISAIRESLSTVKFAQRAKMIRTKAIVNEENSDAEYWRKKYLALLNNNQNNDSNPESRRSRTDPSTMQVDEGSHFYSKHKNADNLTPSWNSTLTK